MKLYRVEIINGQPLETFIANIATEKEGIAKLQELKEHMVNTGYNVKSSDIDHLIVEKTISNGTTVYKRFELE